ncbi:ABC transporter permease [Thermoanaerobacteraceae bacterium SP2]|jgi:ribose/xylose/arabinose/galactoside ABC-type transport system permease subunit|nr:ABC transporter permease [Thermoanaerobacteraceae bacterium SP2]
MKNYESTSYNTQNLEVYSSRVNMYSKFRNLTDNNIFILGIAIVLVLIIGAIKLDSFVGLYNLSRVIRQLSISGLLALGMTFVIIGGNGGIDLSVGSTFGIATMIAISLQNKQIVNTGAKPYPGLDLPLVAIIIICLLAGVIVGLINGLGVTKLKISPFIMTLCMLYIGRGLVLVYSNGFQFIGIRDDFKVLGGGMIANIIPVPTIFFTIITIIAYIMAHKLDYGRRLFAVGANAKAAYISGIKTNQIIVSTYIISGVLAALAGMLFTSFTMVADPWAGDGYELDAISAVLLGGTSLLGGKGTVIGTVLGLVFIALLKNFLTQLNINPYVQQLITALIILVVVLLQQVQNNNN